MGNDRLKEMLAEHERRLDVVAIGIGSPPFSDDATAAVVAMRWYDTTLPDALKALVKCREALGFIVTAKNSDEIRAAAVECLADLEVLFDAEGQEDER